MKTCSKCEEMENDDDQRFCMSCGMDMNSLQTDSKEQNPEQETIKHSTESDKSIGRLVFSDKIVMSVDESQRLVGREDLRKYTKKDPSYIARSQFTIYLDGDMYVIKDGVTNVQYKSSKNGTFLNGEKLVDEMEIKNGDVITVSDVKISFEV